MQIIGDVSAGFSAGFPLRYRDPMKSGPVQADVKSTIDARTCGREVLDLH